MPFNFLVSLLISLAINIVAYLIMPKAKVAKPEAVEDMEGPTAEAGRPIPVPFGDITIKGLNCIWYGEIKTNTFEISAGGGGK